MKIGIVGCGAVGGACALSVMTRGSARELVLLDLSRQRARAVAIDLKYGAPLSPRIDVRDGDYADLAGAALVMITAGVNEKAGGATDRNDAVGRRGVAQILKPAMSEEERQALERSVETLRKAAGQTAREAAE